MTGDWTRRVSSIVFGIWFIGLNVGRTINEPTAPALAYGLEQEGSIMNILVVHFGWGTFKVSRWTIENDVFEVEALPSNTDMQLGGEYFDRRIMEYFIKLIEKKHGKDISKDNRALAKLRREAERAKIALSSQRHFPVRIKSLFDGVDFFETLTRARLEEWNNDLFIKTLTTVKKAVWEDAVLLKHEIDEILFTGGRSATIHMLPKLPPKDYFDPDDDDDETVAYGAAAESVAYQDMVLLDVVGVSLGIGTVDGPVAKLIERNTPIPTKKSLVFTASTLMNQQMTTFKDKPPTVKIDVFEGEGNVTTACKLLAGFDLIGIAPEPRAIPQIEVTFEVDANSILHVKAVDKASSIDGKMRITIGKGSMTVFGLHSEALFVLPSYAKEKAKEKEKIDARNSLETYIYKLKNKLADKLPLDEKDNIELLLDEKDKIETATKEAIKWWDDNQNANKEDYEEKLKELEAVCNPS